MRSAVVRCCDLLPTVKLSNKEGLENPHSVSLGFPDRKHSLRNSPKIQSRYTKYATIFARATHGFDFLLGGVCSVREDDGVGSVRRGQMRGFILTLALTAVTIAGISLSTRPLLFMRLIHYRSIRAPDFPCAAYMICPQSTPSRSWPYALSDRVR